MKKILFFLAIFAVVVNSCFGQFRNMSLSPDSIQEARERGLKIPYYQPKYFNHRNENPVDGKNIFLVPLVRDTILQMLTADGIRWVLQRKGTLFRAIKNVDGTFYIISRNDCGNRVYQFYSPMAKSEYEDTNTGIDNSGKDFKKPGRTR